MQLCKDVFEVLWKRGLGLVFWKLWSPLVVLSMEKAMVTMGSIELRLIRRIWGKMTTDDLRYDTTWRLSTCIIRVSLETRAAMLLASSPDAPSSTEVSMVQDHLWPAIRQAIKKMRKANVPLPTVSTWSIKHNNNMQFLYRLVLFPDRS